MSAENILGVAPAACTDAMLKSALLYVDERIDGLQNSRRIIADEIDRRAVEHRERQERIRLDQLREAQGGRED